MKPIIIVSISLLFYLNLLKAQAQNNQVLDSLQNKLEFAANDTLKLRLLIELSEFYQQVDTKNAELYGIEAVKLAEKSGVKQNLASAYRNLGIAYLHSGDLSKASENCEKSLKFYKKLGNKTGISGCLLSLGTITTRMGNYIKANEYLQQSLLISKDINDEVGVSSCFRNFGILEANQSNYPKAIEYFEQSLTIQENLGNKNEIAICLSNLGVIYNYQGNHSKSIEYQEKALKVSQQTGDKKAISARLINLGVSYDDQSDYDKAINCYDQALEIKKEIDDKVGISMCYNNMGEIYKAKGDYAQAIDYYEQSLNIDNELEDQAGIAICLLNIGNVHYLQNNYEKAFQYYQNSLATAEKFNEKRIIANVLNCTGEVLLKQNQYQQAIANFKRASALSNEIGDESEKAKAAYYLGDIFITQGKYLEAITYLNIAKDLHTELGEKGKVVADYLKIAEAYFLLGDGNKTIEYGHLGLNIASTLGLKDEVKNASEILSKTYAKQLNFEKAYQFSVLFKETHDSIFSLENQKLIHTIENRFELERKEQEIELQNTKLAKQEVEIKQQHFKQNVLLLGLVAGLVIIVLFNIAYARIRKANNTILSQKGKIEESNEELNQSNEELNVTIETVNQQKLQIEKTNKEMTDSIQYAQYIQKAILPHNETFKKLLTDHFVLYKPKNIVSGDFYWTTVIEGKTIIAAADCTGHGVPGAFMSMLGISFLNDIINKEYITHPGVALRRLRKEIINALQQKGAFGEQRDGMDIGLCCIDFATMELQFSGANCPLYIIRDKDCEPIKDAIITEFGGNILYEIKGDSMPIALYEKMDRFKTVEIKILKGDRLYMFSDGYADQFGGFDGKRLMYKSFKQLILEICDKAMDEQKNLLDSAFYEWKQEADQIDDVMVLGILI